MSAVRHFRLQTMTMIRLPFLRILDSSMQMNFSFPKRDFNEHLLQLSSMFFQALLMLLSSPLHFFKSVSNCAISFCYLSNIFCFSFFSLTLASFNCSYMSLDFILIFPVKKLPHSAPNINSRHVCFIFLEVTRELTKPGHETVCHSLVQIILKPLKIEAVYEMAEIPIRQMPYFWETSQIKAERLNSVNCGQF